MSLCVYCQWAFLVRVERRQDLACSPSAGCWEAPGSAALLGALLAFPLVPSRRRAGRSWRAAPGVQGDFLPPGWQHCLLETSSFSSEENVNPVRVSLRGFCAPWLAGRGKPRSLWSLRGGPPAGPEGVPDCTAGVRVAAKKDGRSGRISESQPLPSVRASAVPGRQRGGGPRGERWCGLNCLQEGKNYSKWTNSEI